VLEVCRDFDLRPGAPAAPAITPPLAPGVVNASATRDSSFF
jgi:hypothetical protein